MATWLDTAGIIALATALLLYGLAWIAVRNRSLAVRVVTRGLLLVLFFGPALWVVLNGGAGPTAAPPPREQASSPDARKRVEAEREQQRTANAEAAGKSTAEMDAKRKAEDDLRKVDASKAGRTAAAESAPPGRPVPPSPPAASPESLPTTGGSPRARSASPSANSQWDTVRVFYGTDRARSGDNKRIDYGSGRAGRLELGKVDVTVPKSHEVPHIERPWVVRLPFTSIKLYEQAEDPSKHFTMREINVLSREDFLSLVRAQLAASKDFANRAIVFVHGYNTEFDFAIYRTAQMTYDLGFDGAPFLYSWPSASGVTGYVYDRDSAEQAEPYLKSFLEMVVRETGAKNVSVIAHSMGNRPLLRVLREIAPTLPSGVKVDQVILAAPDVDRDVFEQLARGVTQPDRGVTLYASKNDRAMAAARLVAGGIPRAGDVPPEGPIVVPGVDTIDISSTSSDALVLNHSAYAESKVLIGDIGALIRSGVRPPERRLPALERIATPKGDYWRYP